MKNKILKYKYSPKSLNELILLDRVRKLVENGIQQDYIFFGTPGCGKSTLCNLVSELYSSITVSETSVEILRTKITNFCKHVDIGIDREDVNERVRRLGFDIDITTHNPENIKVVFLDEFEDLSKTFQEGLKSFMERNENVRFIATSNNTNSILPALKSRFEIVHFNSQNIEEEKYLKTKFSIRIKNDILLKENTTLSNSDIGKIVSKTFPDFRSCMNMLQDVIKTGMVDTNNVSNIDISLKNKLYTLIIDNESPEDTYHFINDNFGDIKIDMVIKLLGTPFIHWIFSNKKDWIPKLVDITELVTEYGHKLPTSLDPLVLGLALIYKIQRI